jgi:nicotinamide mononucleotide transporter PnuC
MTFNEFVSGFFGSNTIEISAAICGFICLVLLIRGNIWNFAFGFVQVTLYVWVFYQAKLYSDAGLHVVYMALQIYGWWQWSQHLHTKATVHVETISAKHLTIFLGISVVSFLLLGTASIYSELGFLDCGRYCCDLRLPTKSPLSNSHIICLFFDYGVRRPLRLASTKQTTIKELNEFIFEYISFKHRKKSRFYGRTFHWKIDYLPSCC